MPQPPLLPEEALIRVLRLARFDGMGALVLGGLFALLAASAHEVPFAMIGVLAAGGGAIELHGAMLLRQGAIGGMRWLVASQLLLLLVVFAYCALRVWVIELPEIPESFGGLFAASAQQWGLSITEYQHALNRITAGAVALAALGFQGGMMIYYLRRWSAVDRALRAE
jgi:hypothetical protein